MGFFGIPTNILEILALLAILLTFIKKEDVAIKIIKNLSWVFIFSVLLILIGFLLSIFSNDAELVGLGILKGWFIIPMLFSFALCTQIKSFEYMEKIFFSIYFSSTLVSIIALGYKLIGIVTYDNRLTAFYLSPNHLGMYLAPGIIFGLYFLIKAISGKAFSNKTLVHGVLLSVMILALYFTYSYATCVALFLALFTCLFFIKNHGKLFLIGIVSLIIFAITFFVFQKDTVKFSSLENLSSRSSLASRQTIWKVSTLLIKESPIFGIGPGNFQTAYLSKQSLFQPYLEWAVPQPHNIFLAFWLQAGIIGIVGFLMLLFFIFKSLLILVKNKKNIALAMPLLAFFIYTVLHGLVDTPYWKNDLSFLFWVTIFMTIALGHKIPNEDL